MDPRKEPRRTEESFFRWLIETGVQPIVCTKCDARITDAHVPHACQQGKAQ